MLKALFLDMDETLCDTHAANVVAKQSLAEFVRQLVNAGQLNGGSLDAEAFAQAYYRGIYREWTSEQRARYLPVAESEGEAAFRILLIQDLLSEASAGACDLAMANDILQCFDTSRIAAFDFYPGIPEFLAEARQYFTLVVITNGPEHSQVPKVEKIKLADKVDHILIGGQEPEQKPARSIFEKALTLAGCDAHEAIHVGDSLAADIAGANGCGITSVWIQHQQPLDRELGINPSHTIIKPDEIPAMIRTLHPY